MHLIGNDSRYMFCKPKALEKFRQMMLMEIDFTNPKGLEFITLLKKTMTKETFSPMSKQAL